MTDQKAFCQGRHPTMGLLIVGALLTSTLLWARLDNPFIWMVYSSCRLH
jgi:phospho-N-acetylmuramoyl-pentapeptide-transferase